MNKTYVYLAVPLTGVLVLGARVSSFGQLDQTPPLEKYSMNSTNRLSLSLRYGMNISAKFHGVGSAGGPGHYFDGYVLTDSTGNYLDYTSFWGYQNAAQYNQLGNVNLPANSFSYHNPVPSDFASPSSSGDDANLGLELAYQRQLGVKEDWHNMRYGFEVALNYMKLSTSSHGASLTDVLTDNFLFGGIPGQIPLPGHQGGFNGDPGDPVLVVPGIPGLNTTGTLQSHDGFDADIWGARIGPYIQFPFGKKDQFTLSFSGGLALGFINANESWKQTLTLDNAGGASTISGGGSNFDVLCGWYIDATADYQINERWGLAAGVQYQDLDTYSHNFSGRTAELDLSSSIFFHIGISYNF